MGFKRPQYLGLIDSLRMLPDRRPCPIPIDAEPVAYIGSRPDIAI